LCDAHVRNGRRHCDDSNSQYQSILASGVARGVFVSA
jgi:hypothetical protein